MPSSIDPTTPTMPPPHGAVPRGLPLTPSSSTTTGRFGRMFRRLPFYEHRPESLAALGDTMIQELENGELDEALGVSDPDENRGALSDGSMRLPAGYTYFGQFVDHDITFDPVSSLVRQNDPDALTDFRTPRFDLDSLYGRGPADQPFLYEPGGVKLRLGESRSANPEVAGPDLQRNADERALIGDPRNDENLIVSQLQVAMIKFHNKAVDRVHTDTQLEGDDLFKLAQQTVRWHYQWVVIHDYLRRLVGVDVINDILKPEHYRTSPGSDHSVVRPRLLFYHWREQPFMPVEFSVAAYRFGHSMARPSYLINDVIPVPVVANAARIPFFSQGAGPLTHLNGFRALPNEWGVQWKYLLPGVNNAAGPNDANLPQPSYKIDTELGHPLGALPDSVATAQDLFAGIPAAEAQSLAVRNLLRGRALGLPSGQDVARAMGIKPLSDNDLLGDVDLADPVRTDLNGHAPLWFYILKEAELKANAHRLGPVGGRIVAEVLIGLLEGDPLSYLSVNPTWTPTLPGHTANTYTLTDIINFGL
jgi:Animal haem peroxidase